MNVASMRPNLMIMKDIYMKTENTYNIVDLKNFLVKVNDGRQIYEGDQGHVYIRLDTVEEAIIAAVDHFKDKTYVEIREPEDGRG